MGPLARFSGTLWERGRTIIEASKTLGEYFFEPPRIDGMGYQLPKSLASIES